MKECEKERMMMFVRIGDGVVGIRRRRLDYHEETSSSKCSPINIHIRNWRQDPQAVGWWLFKGKHSLYMIIGGEWKGEEERYLNLLLE